MPPYVPKHKLTAEGVIVDNTLKIIKDNLKTCLDALYPTEAALLPANPAFLPDLANRTFGSFMKLEFPMLVADLVDGEDEDSEDSSRTDEDLRVEMLIAVTDPDGANVTRRLAKYVRALRVILRQAAQPENVWSTYFLGLNKNETLPIAGFKLARKYLPIGKGKDEAAAHGYMRAAELTLTLQFSER